MSLKQANPSLEETDSIESWSINSIASFNELVRNFRDDFDFRQQVHANYSVSEMKFDAYHFLDDGVAPIVEVMEGLCRLRKNVDLIKTLAVTNLIVIDRDDEESGDVCFEVFMRSPPDKNPSAFVAAYGDLYFMELPSRDHWNDCGFGWLLTYCPDCEEGADDLFPWLSQSCDCRSHS